MKAIRKYYTIYRVINNYGETHEFDSKEEAQSFENFVRREKKVLNNIRKDGITLVVSKDLNVFCECIPAFIGFHGIPFCEVRKDKDREHYMASYSHIDSVGIKGGNLIGMLKFFYEIMCTTCSHSFDYWNGAYHFKWDNTYGNRAMQYMCHPNHWRKGAYWYNWNGEEFTTNDSHCSLKTEDFL